MTHELILTSVSRGLDPKDHGFCPVAVDVSISPRVLQHLLALVNYEHFVAEPSEHPVYSHFVLPGEIEHVLSRVSFAGVDYQQKPNVLAHHIVLDHQELVAESPAWLLALPGFHFSEWNEPPLRFPRGRPVPTLINPQPLTRRQQIARQYRWLDPQKMSPTGFVDVESEAYLATVHHNSEQMILAAPPSSPCPIWKELTGDPGWSGVLAETVLTDQPAVIIYNPGQNILPLFVEAMAMLPPYVAWRTSFCTNFTGLPEEIYCQWKGVIAGSEMAKILARDLHSVVLDLTAPMGAAPTVQYVDYARQGQERMLPLEAEEHTTSTVLMQSDTKAFIPVDKSDQTETVILPGNFVEKSESPPPIQLPQKQSGLLELFLRRSSRLQFYILYSIMFVLLLLLVFLAVDQVGNFGVVQRLLNGNQSTAVPLGNNVPFGNDGRNGAEQAGGNISILDIVAPENGEQGISNDATIDDAAIDFEGNLQSFIEHREAQRELLLPLLEDFTVPAFLEINFPGTEGVFVNPPEARMFGELLPLKPYTAALELRYIPLFKLPMVQIETRLVTDALPNVVWEVNAVDTETHRHAPMFLFQWTEAGLEMSWHAEGLSNQHLYDTILSSLGFLQLNVADVPESVKVIPLFAPIKVMPVMMSDLVKITDNVMPPEHRMKILPEHRIELPFASDLWQNIFTEVEMPGILLLEVRAEPEGDWAKIEPLSVSVFDIEIRTSQERGIPSEGGVTFESIAIPIIVSATMEQVVWKAYEYAEWARSELDVLGLARENLERRIEDLQRRLFDGDGTARADRDRLEGELRELYLRRRELESILERLPAAYAEIEQNETWQFHYSVFLESAVSERRLLILTAQ